MRRALVGFLLLFAASSTACGGDAPTVDGGADAGSVLPRDAAADGTVVCASATDCDNGRYCDGVETCAPGRAGGDARGCHVGVPPCAPAATCFEDTDLCSCSTDDVDGDGVSDCDGDCDDRNASRYPGAQEICDSDDEDCDDTTYGVRDEDADGVTSSACCDGPTCGRDCDDGDASIGPTGTEACNGVDDDCDGLVDEGVGIIVYVDADHDGHGDGATGSLGCPGLAGFAPYGDDCDDTTPLRSPVVAEVCDGLDNDCDGLVDDGPPCQCS